MTDKTKRDDEIDFLLSNVNEAPSKSKKVVVSSANKHPFIEDNEHRYTSTSVSTDDLLSPPQSHEEGGGMFSIFSLKPGNDNLFYLLIGMITMIITGTLIVNFGVFISAAAVIFVWFIGWFLVCCGGFYCISRRPKAVHICNGATVGLVFGILAMVSFSIVRDIVSRPVYEYVDVTAVPDFSPQDGSIIYFQNGEISSNFIGQSSVLEDTECTSDCNFLYFCVAPIIDLNTFAKNSSVVDFWAGCQVPTMNNNCTSDAFLSSDCYEAWADSLRAGFAYGTDTRLGGAFLLAAEESAKRNKLITTTGISFNATNGEITFNNTNIIIVLWSEDPEEEAEVFWAIGWVLIAFAPFVFCTYSVLYSAFCKTRMRRGDYETI